MFYIPIGIDDTLNSKMEEYVPFRYTHDISQVIFMGSHHLKLR